MSCEIQIFFVCRSCNNAKTRHFNATCSEIRLKKPANNEFVVKIVHERKPSKQLVSSLRNDTSIPPGPVFTNHSQEYS